MVYSIHTADPTYNVGAVFGLLVGIVSTHELLLGYRLPAWLSRIHSTLHAYSLLHLTRVPTPSVVGEHV